jgi:GDP-L-fucose synthase
MNILESCIPFPNIKVINLGSSCIYPLNAPNPISEDEFMNGQLEETNSPYAMAKISAIEIGRAISTEFGHKVINLMPTNLYGPNDFFHPVNGHVIPSLIARMHDAKLNKDTEFNIWGTGTPLREFLFVDDLAECVKFVIDKNIDNDLINVGSSVEISIANLAVLIKDSVGFEGELIFDTSKPDGNPRKLLDSSLINSLGWKSKTTLERGLKYTYDWYVENKEIARH